MMKARFFLSLFTLFINSYGFASMTNNLEYRYKINNDSQFKGTIIFENGCGIDMSEWNNPAFINNIKNKYSVFFYNRRGIGKSIPDYSKKYNEQTAIENINYNLLSLLKAKSVKPPYILIAHSYGALYSGYFALKFPELVRAVIFIDPIPKNFTFSRQILADSREDVKFVSQHSISDAYQHLGGSKAEAIYQVASYKNDMEIMKSFGHIQNSIPVIIFSSTETEKNRPFTMEDWFNAQKEWLNNNPSSKIISVDAGHFIQTEKPQILSMDILALINKIKD